MTSAIWTDNLKVGDVIPIAWMKGWGSIVKIEPYEACPLPGWRIATFATGVSMSLAPGGVIPGEARRR